MSKKVMNTRENTGAIYTRYSSAGQREESNEAQIRACMEFAQRNGINIVKTYSDSAKSGTTAEREKFLEMIQDSEQGLFKTLLIHKFDRFARNKYDSAIFKRKLNENGVRIISVTENLDDSPEGMMLESVLEGMAQYFSLNLAREVMKGMRESAYNCTHLGGIPPLGYDVDPTTKKYVVNEGEAAVVRAIFSKYADGIGYSQILGYLNGMGHKTKRGYAFGKSSLNKMLSNEKYTGKFIFNRMLEKDMSGNRRPQEKPREEWIIVPGGLPTIIDQETFEKVQVKLANNRKNGGRFKAREVYLLSGIVFCGECGSNMYGNTRHCGRNKTKYSSYRCSDRVQHKGCRNKELRKEYLEGYVLDQMYNRLFSENSIKQLSTMLNEYNQRRSAETNTELAFVTGELEEVVGKISKIIRLVSEAGISIDTVAADLKQLEERKRFLESHIQDITLATKTSAITEDMIVDLVAQSSEFVRTKNIAECRNFIESYVDRVVVFEERVEVFFRINVPSGDVDGAGDGGDSGPDTLTPLKSEEGIKALRKEYRNNV